MRFPPKLKKENLHSDDVTSHYACSVCANYMEDDCALKYVVNRRDVLSHYVMQCAHFNKSIRKEESS